ncbi:hypothetical protein OIU77_014958 [Salix suchowensis]|uniref:Uncharacterized protein n=1 Tax=Salix suchowensis TaxID=1278906 RepID=A0ABQ8ZZ60_9ROSI|nr:hypothetical protein OIU77_014958 [Salix suchowensis]
MTETKQRKKDNPGPDPKMLFGPQNSSRSKRLRSLVAASSVGTCFFFENDGKGSEFGAGDTAKADPAYTSHFPFTGHRRFLICFENVLGCGPNRAVLVTTKSPPFPCPFFKDDSSDSPRRKAVTFSTTLLFLGILRSSTVPDFLEIDGSDCFFLWPELSNRTAVGFSVKTGVAVAVVVASAINFRVRKVLVPVPVVVISPTTGRDSDSLSQTILWPHNLSPHDNSTEHHHHHHLI